LIPGGNIDKIYILSKSQGLVAAKLPPFFGKKPTFIHFLYCFLFTFQDENSQKERYGVDMWLTFFFFGLCSKSILDFRFVPLFLKQNKE
jgi:hypothetical protein